MRFRKEFEIPMNKTSTVVATIELSNNNCLEQIIIHPISTFSDDDYATVSIKIGNKELYRGELMGDGMVIDMETCLLDASGDLTVSVECNSLWTALTGDYTSNDTQETYWVKCSLVFIDNTIVFEETEDAIDKWHKSIGAQYL
jgi:hypothetical protein|tara:strand:- start:1107 stop:1535 length:429 start_codon:yes stop_codon:yes gene_type:complete